MHHTEECYDCQDVTDAEDPDCQDTTIMDRPVDDQESVEKDEDNTEDQDGLMDFPITNLVNDNDDENDTNPLVVRLVALMEHVARVIGIHSWISRRIANLRRQ